MQLCADCMIVSERECLCLSPCACACVEVSVCLCVRVCVSVPEGAYGILCTHQYTPSFLGSTTARPSSPSEVSPCDGPGQGLLSLRA